MPVDSLAPDGNVLEGDTPAWTSHDAGVIRHVYPDVGEHQQAILHDYPAPRHIGKSGVENPGGAPDPEAALMDSPDGRVGNEGLGSDDNTVLE